MRYVAALILALGALSGVLLQGEFMRPLQLTCCVLLALVLAIIFFVASTSKESRGAPRHIWQIWLMFAGGLFFSWLVSFSIYHYRMHEAKSYVARAIVVLEKIKARDHAYPPSLPVSELGQPPTSFKGDRYYYSDGKTYTFEFFEPSGVLGELLNLEYFISQRQARVDPLPHLEKAKRLTL